VIDCSTRQQADERSGRDETLDKACFPVDSRLQTLFIPPHLQPLGSQQVIKSLDVSRVRCHSIANENVELGLLANHPRDLFASEEGVRSDAPKRRPPHRICDMYIVWQSVSYIYVSIRLCFMCIYLSLTAAISCFWLEGL
jgi:hypothetical protein